MTKIPTGTVTFLFSDIEGSTQRWERNAQAMEAAFKRQEEIMRSAMENHGGYIYKMIGDAFQVAFSSAPAALAAALEAQRRLSTEPWGEMSAIKVRMALHTGETEERGEDYVGPLLNRVARLMSAGHGGQVLLTRATAGLVQDHLLEGVWLRDLGQQRLKDLERPEHVFQLAAPDIPVDFPALRSPNSHPNNLPVQLTSFIGRDQVLNEVLELLDTTHLLTLTGSGGTGKTRLALHAATGLLSVFPDGVWLVDMAPLSDPELVPQSVASVLGVRDEPGAQLTRRIAEALHHKNLLLIIDNCEHLIQAVADLAEALLHACPDVKLLVTSREALGISGETAYRVPSLSLPPDGAHAPRQAHIAAQYEAVRLFVDRAMTVRPDFALTDANAEAVVQIVRRLDGVPLALELAAARVRALGVEQIAARLDDRFQLLTGGSRTALPRQQTLRALIDWSWDLLSDEEKRLFRRLAVFLGGWTMEAAEAVCKDEGGIMKDEYGADHPSPVPWNASSFILPMCLNC